jgi:hypothetical protein
MIKHTPGPWRKDNNPRNIIANGRDIAHTWGRFEDDEADANAHLISAAPDLLKALHDVLRYCVTPSGLPDKNKGRTPEQDAAMARANAAIAKANGVRTKFYAIKTANGYFALQGKKHWFESVPLGCALFPTEEYARIIGKRHHSEIGTATEDGYAIVPVN